LQLQSGDNSGYLLRNTVQTGLERRRPYTFFLQPGADNPISEFFLRVWIDLNQDGVFTDSIELMVDPVEPIGITGWSQPITIADSVPLGETRMRIALQALLTPEDSIRPEACGNLLFGEVEDYCIRIDDLCPEVIPVVLETGENNVQIAWNPVLEAFGFIYRYRKVGDDEFSEATITVDTMITLGGLEECTDYELQTLSVCVQDTSSWKSFVFKTQCPPNAVRDLLPVAENVRVYPVPFSDALTVEFIPVLTGSGNLRLHDILGQQVHSEDLSFARDALQQVNVSALERLPHGLYVISLESLNRRQVFKVVK
jgi:hypothetical protein